MAGYSGTPLAKKLGIKPGAVLSAIDSPAEWLSWVEPLPPGVKISPTKPKPESADVLVCFVRCRADLSRHFDRAKRALKKDGGLWIAWPKQAARKIDAQWETDLSEQDVRSLALASGLVDNKVCAISDVWSGLRLVYRLSDR